MVVFSLCITIAVFIFACDLGAECRYIHLEHGWTISNGNDSIILRNQSIPSGIYSALEEANLTESVLIGYNDVNLRWIAMENWTYTLQFSLNNTSPSNIVLVFHGLDTIASVFLNDERDTGRLQPSPNNMFTRYAYNIKNSLKSGDNSLKVIFESPVVAAKNLANRNKLTPPECPPAPYNGECHMNMLRKMQASFSWDWGLAAPSVGIWKPVILEVYETAIIRDLNYRLQETDNSWLISITVHLEAGVGITKPRTVQGLLTVQIEDVTDATAKRYITIQRTKNGEFSENLSLEIPKNRIEVWWPNGHGSQKLYVLRALWEGEIRNIETNEILVLPSEYLNDEKNVRVGFRTVELIEEPVDGGLSFYLRINHVPMFMKGTNWIPSQILPEKSFDLIKVRRLLYAVKDAHMNMIRVWGGGIYESDQFYDIADELGILIWQDMMFACAMYPVFDEFKESVATEIKQNIRRLQSHASIALWAGNNENEAALRQNWYGTSKEYSRFADEYIELYDGIIKEAVLENDQWHIWLYSSPSNGNIQSNKSVIQTDPQDWHYGDIHFYNYLSDGWSPSIYPRPRFVSEYGFQSFPSLNSWKSVLQSGTNLSNLMDHRQHFPAGGSAPVINLIQKHLPLPAENSRRYLSALIYFSQLSQAIVVRTESEVYRIERGGTMNTMGALYWQLNDVWVAPSWSSIEHNGNYKILHHWAKEFFAPTALIAHRDETLNHINVYIVRDTLQAPEPMQVHLQIFNWDSLDVQFEKSHNVTVQPNGVQLVDSFEIRKYLHGQFSRENCVLQFSLRNGIGETISRSHILPEYIKKTIGIVRNPKIQVEITSQTCNGTTGIHSATLQISVQYPALFVYITINNDVLSEYTFSKNGYIQLQAIDTVSVNYNNMNCNTVILERRNIKVKTVNRYMT